MKIYFFILMFMLALFTGCANLKQEVWLYEDGSAKLYAELVMDKEMMTDAPAEKLLTQYLNPSDPNFTAINEREFEENGYLHHFAEVTVKDFEQFATQGFFGYTRFQHKEHASGNNILTMVIESPNREFQMQPLRLSEEELAVIEPLLADSYVTLIVHTPDVINTDGEIIAQNSISATAQFQLPAIDAIAGIGRESFSVEYALAPVTKKPITAGENNKASTPTNGATATTTSTISTANSATPSPIAIDQDGDWLSDSDEATLGSDPTKVDTDDDTISDFEETFIFKSNPLQAETDTDGDGFTNTVEEQLFQSDPARADNDRDGDLLPDSVEAIIGTNDESADSDGDLLSDLIEVYLLESNPNEADADTDTDGFPDIFETWLPTQMADAACEVDVTFTLNSLAVNDPEEADTNSITGGDEVNMLYMLLASQDGNFYGTTFDNQSGDPNYQGSAELWQGEGFQNKQFTNFKALGPLTARCGYQVGYGVGLFEDDSPWGGRTDMGRIIENFPLLIQRIPIGWGASQQAAHHFEGVSYDGSYDYELNYSFTIGVPNQAPDKGADQQDAETVVANRSQLAVERSSDAIAVEVQATLPTVYLSTNERLTFRHQPAWTIVAPPANWIPISYTVGANDVLITTESATVTPTIAIYDPVHIIETVAIENFEDATTAEVLHAYLTQSGVASKSLRADDFTEVQLGEKTALRWQPSDDKANNIWLAFRALDESINILRYTMPVTFFDEQATLWLGFAETVDYQAPSRRLDEIEKSLRKFIAATATGDYETMQTLICRRNREANDMVGSILGGIFGFDAQAMAGAFLSFSSGWTELDTSGLFFETLEESGGMAQVFVSGVVSLNGSNGRETISFRQFNVIGRSLYRLQQEEGGWFICD